jgi:hypothetical protein
VREDDTSADAFLADQGRDYLLLVAKEITSLRTQQEKARVAALQVLMADEDRVSGLRESLAAATFRLEGPLNMMASVVGMLARRQGETDPMSVALAEALAAGQQALADLRSMIPGEDPRSDRRRQPQRTAARCPRPVHRPPARRRHHRDLATAGDLAGPAGCTEQAALTVQGADRQCHRGDEHAWLP